MTINNTISLCQLCSDNILGFAQVLGSLATAGALIAMIINNRQQREQWLNDAFAKNEADMWINYRNQFYKLTYDFTRFIGCLHENIGMTSRKDFKQDFKEKRGVAADLIHLHNLIKPYFEFNNIIDWEQTRKLLTEIMLFYVDLDERVEFSQETREENKIIFYEIKPENYTDIKNCFLFRATFKYKINKEIFNEDTIKIKEYFRLFINEINQINKALNAKVTAHLKSK